MSGRPARGSSTPSGLLGGLKSWLQARSSRIWPSSVCLPAESRAPDIHFQRRVRLLVVDDNPVNLMAISALLEPRGLEPLLAADGAEAVALACELNLDLISMDLQMPVLDGLEATAAIRRFEVGKSTPPVPVVAYSSSPPGWAVLAAHGLNGSLNKPCRDQDLEDCLVRWCPSYRSAPTPRGIAHATNGWQAASRHAGPGGAPMR